LQSISCRIEAVCVKTLHDGKPSFGPSPPETAQAAWQSSPLFELASVLVRVDHVASRIVRSSIRRGWENCVQAVGCSERDFSPARRHEIVTKSRKKFLSPKLHPLKIALGDSMLLFRAAFLPGTS
jgi:hypothetical protein